MCKETKEEKKAMCMKKEEKSRKESGGRLKKQIKKERINE